MRRHHPRVIRLCASLLSDQALGEDAAQEVFLRAYRDLRKFRGDGAFPTWLYRIACRHCADVLRSSRRRPAASIINEPASRSPSPAEAVESVDLLRKLLIDLPSESRTALVLYEVEGLSYEEIAAVMNCSLDSVKSRLRRTRESLTEKARSL